MEKKLLILIFVLMLALSSCATNKDNIPANIQEQSNNIDTNENSEESYEEANESIEIPDEENRALGKRNDEDNNVKPEDNNSEDNKDSSVEIGIGTLETVTDKENNDASNEAETAKQIEEPVKEEAEETKESEDIKEAENVLKVQGLLENELSITLDELKLMNDLIFEADFYSLNSFGTTGYTHFKGVNLWSLMEEKAVISSEAIKVTVIAQDGYKMEFTIDQVKKQDYIDETNPDAKYPMIIAWEENGEEYTTDEGAPYKLVVGQKEAGDVNKPQWISNIDKIIIE